MISQFVEILNTNKATYLYQLGSTYGITPFPWHNPHCMFTIQFNTLWNRYTEYKNGN